jgi:hypothetical protein
MRGKLLIAGLIFLSACAGGDYSAREDGSGFRPSVCARVPVGVAAFQYIDPSLKHLKISCADVARCAALRGQGAPPNVPCE